MLICKNCNAENADNALICDKCKIKGSQNFIYIAGRQATPDNDAASAPLNSIVVCWNCGRPSGEGEKCPYCQIRLRKTEVLKPVFIKKPTAEKGDEGTTPPPSMKKYNH